MSGIEIQHKESKWVKNTISSVDRKSNEFDKTMDFNQKMVDFKYELQPVYEIYALRENSPGFKVGLKEGDLVLKINGRKATTVKIDFFNDLFTSEDGKQITIVVDRKGKILTFKFKLEKIL
jgi:C-terminal processing protease CtpA/Prc